MAKKSGGKGEAASPGRADGSTSRQRHSARQQAGELCGVLTGPVNASTSKDYLRHYGGERQRPSALVDTRVIYCGDNLEQLKKLPDACVDLIYIDPPFNSNRNCEIFWPETSEKRRFEQVLRQVKARYVAGLTATPQRKDGHHPIIVMQCGPIRYRVNAKEQPQASGSFLSCSRLSPQ